MMSSYLWLCGGVGILLALVFVYALCKVAASSDRHIDEMQTKARVFDHFFELEPKEGDE